MDADDEVNNNVLLYCSLVHHNDWPVTRRGSGGRVGSREWREGGKKGGEGRGGEERGGEGRGGEGRGGEGRGGEGRGGR